MVQEHPIRPVESNREAETGPHAYSNAVSDRVDIINQWERMGLLIKDAGGLVTHLEKYKIRFFLCTIH